MICVFGHKPELKTERQTNLTESLAENYKTEIKICANPGFLLY